MTGSTVGKNQRPVFNLKRQEYSLAGYEANRYSLSTREEARRPRVQDQTCWVTWWVWGQPAIWGLTQPTNQQAIPPPKARVRDWLSKQEVSSQWNHLAHGEPRSTSKSNQKTDPNDRYWVSKVMKSDSWTQWLTGRAGRGEARTAVHHDPLRSCQMDGGIRTPNSCLCLSAFLHCTY